MTNTFDVALDELIAETIEVRRLEVVFLKTSEKLLTASEYYRTRIHMQTDRAREKFEVANNKLTVARELFRTTQLPISADDPKVCKFPPRVVASLLALRLRPRTTVQLSAAIADSEDAMHPLMLEMRNMGLVSRAFPGMKHNGDWYLTDASVVMLQALGITVAPEALLP